MAKEGEGAVVRQTHLIAVVGAFMIGCTFVLLVGCSGNIGSQPSGSQDSEVSQSAEAGSERTGPRESESTVAGSQQGGAQDSESTHEVAVHGESIMTIPGHPTYFLMKVDGITYYTRNETPVNVLKDDDLGSLFAEVTWQSTTSTTRDQPASKPVPVYAVKGYDPSFRLAARIDHRLRIFEAFFNPKANEASDILDIGGKVSLIVIGHWRVETGPVGSIEDPEKIEQLVRGFMDAPLKPTYPDHFGTIDTLNLPTNPEAYTGTKDLNHYGIDFLLKDGTYVGFAYRMDTGRLIQSTLGGVKTPASGIVAPQAFRAAIEEAAKWALKDMEKLKAAVLRQKRMCADTRTTNEARRIKLNGVPYTTNDVPGGPWGGVLRGTEENDKLLGEGGEDEIYGLGGDDTMEGGACDDEIYGGPGRDDIVGDWGLGLYDLGARSGKDILYGGDGNDTLTPGKDRKRDEVYCGKGYDIAMLGDDADKIDYVDDSCEKTGKWVGPPA
jgi:hypothetical protein